MAQYGFCGIHGSIFYHHPMEWHKLLHHSHVKHPFFRGVGTIRMSSLLSGVEGEDMLGNGVQWDNNTAPSTGWTLWCPTRKMFKQRPISSVCLMVTNRWVGGSVPTCLQELGIKLVNLMSSFFFIFEWMYEHQQILWNGKWRYIGFKAVGHI